MTDDPTRPPTPRPALWPVSFDAAAEAHLDAVLAATPAQRLAWLEEALGLASRTRVSNRAGGP